MGQHKNPNRKPKALRWILATKWFNEVKKDNKVETFWTPIGGLSRIPFSFATCQEAMDELKNIAAVKDDVKNLMVVALEVRYEPKKIKLLDETWRNKYVKQEVNLQIVDKNKGKEIFNA